MYQPITNSATEEQIAAALQALGVKFVHSEPAGAAPLPIQPARLVAALALSQEARLRLALIPLLLQYPQWAEVVASVAQQLSPAARLTLQCYYTAALWLGEKYRPRLESLLGKQAPLPDYFSTVLGIEKTPDPDENLRRLAIRQRELSGAQVNWLGTYHHALKVWIKGLEIKPSERQE